MAAFILNRHLWSFNVTYHSLQAYTRETALSTPACASASARNKYVSSYSRLMLNVHYATYIKPIHMNMVEEYTVHDFVVEPTAATLVSREIMTLEIPALSGGNRLVLYTHPHLADERLCTYCCIVVSYCCIFVSYCCILVSYCCIVVSYCCIVVS
jgi:hypothetical protein